MFKLLKRKALHIGKRNTLKSAISALFLSFIIFGIYSLTNKNVSVSQDFIASNMYRSTMEVFTKDSMFKYFDQDFLQLYYKYGQEAMDSGDKKLESKALKAGLKYKNTEDGVSVKDIIEISIGSDDTVTDEDIEKLDSLLNKYIETSKSNNLKDLVNVFGPEKAKSLEAVLPVKGAFQASRKFYTPEEIYDAKHSKMHIVEAMLEFIVLFAVIFGFFAIIKLLMKKSVEKFETLKTNLEEALHSAKEIANEIIFATFKMTFVALNEAKDTVATQKMLNEKAIEDRKELREKLDNGELELDADEIQVKLDEADEAVIVSQEKLEEAMALVSIFELELAEEKLELDEKYKSQTVPLETTRESAEQEIQENKVKLEKACDELINASDKYRENFSRFYKKDDALLVSTKEFLAVYREDLNEQTSTDEVKKSALTKLFAAISSKLEARDAKKAEKKAKA